MVRKGVVHEPAHVVDLLPTMLQVAGAEYPDNVDGKPTPTLDGRSLMPLLRGGTRAAPEILISGFTERFRMVRISDWKIVRVNAESWELFDLRADPTELVNLATKNPEKLASMVTAYHHWIEKEQAVLPRFEEVSDP